MLQTLTAFARDASGATPIEYGLLAALINAVLIGCIFVVAGVQVRTG